MESIDHTLFPQGKPTDPEAISMIAEQYKLVVDVWDRVRARRQQSNVFFLSINSALLVAITAITKDGSLPKQPSFLSFCVGLVGLIICGLWFETIVNYKSLTDRKYEIIMRLEQVLPGAPFSAESWPSERGKPIQRHFTRIERGVPLAFFLLYLGLLGKLFYDHSLGL
jgi:hypothetical protein